MDSLSAIRMNGIHSLREIFLNDEAATGRIFTTESQRSQREDHNRIIGFIIMNAMRKVRPLLGNNSEQHPALCSVIRLPGE